MSNHITQKEFAEMMGVSAPYINKLVKKGVIRLINGKIDPEQAKASMKTASEPTRESVVNKPQDKPVSTSDSASPHKSLIKSRAIKEHYKAGLAKMEYEEKADVMVNLNDYNAALTRHLSARDIVLRNYILSIPTRCAIKWPDPATRGQLKQVLEDEICEILTEMSKPNLEAVRREMNRGNI